MERPPMRPNLPNRGTSIARRPCRAKSVAPEPHLARADQRPVHNARPLIYDLNFGCEDP